MLFSLGRKQILVPQAAATMLLRNLKSVRVDDEVIGVEMGGGESEEATKLKAKYEYTCSFH